MAIELKTSINYDFSHEEYSIEDKMRIIKKYERLVKGNFSNIAITFMGFNTTSYFKFTFYLLNHPVEFQYADNTLYITMEGHETLKRIYTTDSQPFYNHPVYFMLEWLFKGTQENNLRMDFITALQYVESVYNVLNTMVNNYSQWVNQI